VDDLDLRIERGDKVLNDLEQRLDDVGLLFPGRKVDHCAGALAS
jgi:hypothetical protein